MSGGGPGVTLEIRTDFVRESVRFVVDGEDCGGTNHDESGWTGMRAMEDLMRSVAHRLGWEVTEVEADGED